MSRLIASPLRAPGKSEHFVRGLPEPLYQLSAFSDQLSADLAGAASLGCLPRSFFVASRRFVRLSQIMLTAHSWKLPFEAISFQLSAFSSIWRRCIAG
jgi:hypothetical protein